MGKLPGSLMGNDEKLNLNMKSRGHKTHNTQNVPCSRRSTRVALRHRHVHQTTGKTKISSYSCACGVTMSHVVKPSMNHHVALSGDVQRRHRSAMAPSHAQSTSRTAGVDIRAPQLPY